MTDAWDGYPENRERCGWHWIESTTTGKLMCAEWRADRVGWSLYRSTSEHHAPNEMFSWRYIGPCLLPAEVEAERDQLREALRRIGAGNGCTMLTSNPPICSRAFAARTALGDGRT